MFLVIVESPTKAKTISRFLSKDYKIKSSFGHIRDLPKKKLGIDLENNFKPHYTILPDKRKVVKDLKEASKKVERVYLATDEDREGEAISWHLMAALGLPDTKTARITFHEITKSAILQALKNPRSINQNLVDAQQARRILDRLVGYKLSPFLWKKVRKGLSAGRVQSVAVRLIVERERERDKFKAEEYWTIEVLLKRLKPDKSLDKISQRIRAQLIKIDHQTLSKLDIKTKEEAHKISQDLKEAQFIVESIIQKEIQKNPKPPLTTSTLQQEAANRFAFSAKKTMLIAQRLYEGRELKNKKATGLITYMRTDSLNLAEKAIREAQRFIVKNYTSQYSRPTHYKTKSRSAQEAHEAIRPTLISRTPSSIKHYLSSDEYKLYDLIWRRTVASQMSPAIFDSTTVDIKAEYSKKDKIYTLRARGLGLKFDGFTRVYPLASQEEILPPLKRGESLSLVKVSPLQHFTESPPRYTEASLIKTLEKEGIGRPSTYAPIISTIQSRGYVIKEERVFRPQEIGILVNDLLVNHFPRIVDLKFTAQMEEKLDQIAQGKIEWQPMIKTFFIPFQKQLKKKEREVEKYTEETDELCPKCKKPLLIKFGRFGKFYACSNFPRCKYTAPLKSEEEEALEREYAAERCEKCGKKMVVKNSKFGFFLACAGFPKCKNIKNIERKIGVKCPQCSEGDLTERRTKKGKIFYGCNQYPECKFALWNKPTGEKCPDCQNLIVLNKADKRVCSVCKREWKKEHLG